MKKTIGFALAALLQGLSHAAVVEIPGYVHSRPCFPVNLPSIPLPINPVSGPQISLPSPVVTLPVLPTVTVAPAPQIAEPRFSILPLERVVLGGAKITLPVAVPGQRRELPAPVKNPDLAARLGRMFDNAVKPGKDAVAIPESTELPAVPVGTPGGRITIPEQPLTLPEHDLEIEIGN